MATPTPMRTRPPSSSPRDPRAAPFSRPASGRPATSPRRRAPGSGRRCRRRRCRSRRRSSIASRCWAPLWRSATAPAGLSAPRSSRIFSGLPSTSSPPPVSTRATCLPGTATTGSLAPRWPYPPSPAARSPEPRTRWDSSAGSTRPSPPARWCSGASPAWLLPLVVGEILRPRLGYDVRRWATVFPARRVRRQQLHHRPGHRDHRDHRDSPMQTRPGHGPLGTGLAHAPRSAPLALAGPPHTPTSWPYPGHPIQLAGRRSWTVNPSRPSTKVPIASSGRGAENHARSADQDLFPERPWCLPREPVSQVGGRPGEREPGRGAAPQATPGFRPPRGRMRRAPRRRSRSWTLPA
jgi:hypothetical protein